MSLSEAANDQIIKSKLKKKTLCLYIAWLVAMFFCTKHALETVSIHEVIFVLKGTFTLVSMLVTVAILFLSYSEVVSDLMDIFSNKTS